MAPNSLFYYFYGPVVGFSAIFEVPWQLVRPSEETNCI